VLEVAVRVSVAGPTTAEADAVSFRVFPVKVAATPVGSPAIEMIGVPVKPFSGVTVSVLVPEAPCVTLKLAGAAANVKLGPAFTVRLILIQMVDVPEVPVTWTVVVPSGAA
jgi:hypothetical protein